MKIVGFLVEYFWVAVEIAQIMAPAAQKMYPDSFKLF